MTTVRATLVTIVSLYGPKTGPLHDLLATVQGTAAEVLGTAFIPYSQAQVHGTLIVLGGYRAAAGEVVNEHYLELRGERHAMDFGLAQRLVLDQLAEPLAIRDRWLRPGGPGPVHQPGAAAARAVILRAGRAVPGADGLARRGAGVGLPVPAAGRPAPEYGARRRAAPLPCRTRRRRR